MGKHTPGPWEHEPGTCAVMATDPGFGNGEIALVARFNSQGYARDNWESNARLIARAPDLLAALEWVVTCCDPNNPSEMDDGGLRDQEHAIERARAAIARAKGES
jgi:hypothetical protein